MQANMENSCRPKETNKRKSTRKKLANRFHRKKIDRGFVISIDEFDFFPKHSENFTYLSNPEKSVLLEDEEKSSESENVFTRLFESGKPQVIKPLVRERGKGRKGEDETWIFTSGHDSERQKKVFWKTSKPSFPVSLTERTSNLLQNQNMLWRSLQHLQKFCEEKRLNMQQISEVVNMELQKIAENNSLQIECLLAEKEPAGRKTRLSRWTFLGHENKTRAKPIKFESDNYYVQGRSFSNGRLEKENRRRERDLKNESFSTGEHGNCSCEKCADDPNEKPSLDANKQLRKIKMAPNSEEDSQIALSNKRGWGMEFADKEPLRPPVYNPEDYATSLKKWGKKGNMGAQLPQYLSQSTGSLEKISEELGHRNKRQSSPSTKSSSSVKSDEKQSKKEKESTLKMEKKDLKNKENINRGLKSDLQKDFLNPILSLSAQTGEMSLRQFSSVTELLGKLKQDLKLSFPSFVQEFVGDPIDGVTLLLELLRSVQLSQTSQLQRCPPQILRRALLDEHSCLVCLKHCLRCSDASRRLASSSAGLFTLAVCIMSNVTQSRIIALELLTKACEPQAGGHKAVSEALSTLRLRFGEPVRFRFLVGMLSSAGAIELLATAMKFINVFVESAPNLQQKIYIQAELQQAGFDSEVLRKTLPSNSESVKLELNKWDKNYIDIEALHNKVSEANVLQEKIHLLEKRIKILQEEKGILQSLEQCLKERCSELEEEVSIKTTATSKISPAKPFRSQQQIRNTEKGESTPAEDEGISSSEQELSQDEDYIKGRIPYSNSKDLEPVTNLKKSKNLKQFKSEPNIYLNKSSECKMTTSCNLKNIKNVRSNKMKESNVDDGNEIIQPQDEEEEEETTIDEVIEELENIVNDAETEVYANEEKVKILNSGSPETLTEVTSEEKYQTYTRHTFISQQKNNFEESEIVPAIIHPQPPKKSKSLVHIYFMESDFDSHDRNKSEFFEDSDSESSDSLLTDTREKKPLRKACHKSLEVSDSFNSFSSVNTRSLFIKQEQDFEESELNTNLCYEERNIDEEEIKRKHLKKNGPPKIENNQSESSEVMFNNKKSQLVQNDGVMKSSSETLNGFCTNYERAAFFQAAKKSFEALNEASHPRTQKCVPAPVKRSQTFHMTSSNSDNFQKRNEVKPKPKMGVSGLDFQRTSEQKIKHEHWKYQAFEYKKNLDKRLDANDRYLKKVSKDTQRGEDDQTDDRASTRRGSFSGSFSIVNGSRCNNAVESLFRKDSFSAVDKSSSSVRSKSVEKMDEGLDSLVDIVISTDETKKPKPRNDWNGEGGKNIGPRTRRSLAESSLFCPQYANNKQDESSKPPKPAQRTSLARNNSSSAPLHLPIEIKLAPVQQKRQQQVIYNFGLTPAKSMDSLLTSPQTKRCPPEGSSSPVGLNKTQESPKFSEDKAPVYSSPVKPTKIQTFFGNPKFEGSSGNDQGINHKYFETNYAAITSENSSRVTRNVQNAKNSPSEKLKPQVLSSNQQQKPKANGYKPPGAKDNQVQSKPNFLLGTYQSQASKSSPPKSKFSGSVLQSINTFNNSFVNRNNALGGLYSGKKNQEFDFSTKVMSGDVGSNRHANSNGTGSEKVTDSPSGLY